MQFESEVQEAVLSALAGIEGINGVFLERPVRASPPYLVLGELAGSDWGAKDAPGRELRIIVRVHDEGESWMRAATLQGEAARAIEALPRTLGDWSLGAVVLLRARTLRDGTRGWLATVEYRVRGMKL